MILILFGLFILFHTFILFKMAHRNQWDSKNHQIKSLASVWFLDPKSIILILFGVIILFHTCISLAAGSVPHCGAAAAGEGAGVAQAWFPNPVGSEYTQHCSAIPLSSLYFPISTAAEVI